MKEFVLPTHWSVKASNVEEDDILIKWRDGGHCDEIGKSYMLSVKQWSPTNSGYTEITFEQFKKYVLKETIEEPKVMEKDWSKATKEELLEEAERRYPVGCKYWNLNLIGEKSNPNVKIENLPSICEDALFKFSNTKSNDGEYTILVYGKGIARGWVYSNGKWAEIASLPEPKVEYVECIHWSGTYFKVGKIYYIDNEKIYFNKLNFILYNNYLNNFKPSTKEAFYAQNKPKQSLKQVVHCKTQ